MVELSVCIGSACHIRGSYNVIQIFQQLIEEKRLHETIDFKSTFCMKQCKSDGVSVCVNHKVYRVRPENAREFFQTTIEPLT